MNLAQALSSFIGQTIEVHYPGEFHVGTLLRVETAFIVLRETGAGYAPREVVIAFTNIEHIRVVT